MSNLFIIVTNIPIGNHVQWFCAEADMQRWQEQWELHQAELDHLLFALDYMKTVWQNIANQYSD